MTDEPTDEALENLFVEETGFATDDFPAAIFDFARAVLAKWGQPAQAAEPVAWLDPWTGTKVTTDYDAYGKHGIPLYTTPQPTQAQAGAMATWAAVQEHCETLADFQEGQWWVNELDAMASHPIGQTIRVTPDMLRAVAVVHNLLRAAATPQPAPATQQAGWTNADADAARLALELECLLMDTKDTAAVSKWWQSANEALELHRARLQEVQPSPTAQVADSAQEDAALPAKTCSTSSLKGETP